MDITEERRGRVVVLRPVGRINNETSAEFERKLLATIGTTPAAVLVDLSTVEYISSAGLRVLMIAARQSKASAGRLAVAELAPLVKEIFTITRFSQVVPVFETTAEAIPALA